jgi:hypothetical protein
MRRFFHWASLYSVLALSSSVIGAETEFNIKSFDTDALVNANDDSVVPASCQTSDDCNAVGLSCGKTPMRLNCNALDCGNWLQNTVAFSGAEVFKTHADNDFTNSAGFVNGLNTGFRLGSSNIRGQVGGSVGVFDLKGRTTTAPRQTENQGFLTTGIFKRSNIGAGDRISWGVVYDQLWNYQHGIAADDIYLGQFRSIVGVALNSTDEIGFWGTARTNKFTVQNRTYQAISQYNMFWSHNFPFGARSMIYAGLADHASIGSWTTGTQLIAPMGPRMALWGNSAFLFPSSTTGPVGANETLWSLSCGLSYSFGRKTVSRNISGICGMPLLPVANNGTFMVERDFNGIQQDD